jgi:periplasmic mercuric ion binding protein
MNFMKTMRLFLAVMLAAFVSMNLTAQTAANTGKNKNEAIKVLGNCSMCKDRIEKAAKAEGAEAASWDAKTKLLTVSYNPSKTSNDALAKKMASVGHDAGKYKAVDKVYNALPGCCKYDRTGNQSSQTDHSGHTH